MEQEEEFYDIIEQSKYKIVISQPKNIEELSDLFITREELYGLTGNRYIHMNRAGNHQITLAAEITKDLELYADKLVASKKKTLPIDNEDLLDALQNRYVSDFLQCGTYRRHGKRICYARQFKRKKTKVTRADVTRLWEHLFSGFQTKYHVWPPHVPRYDRQLNLFKAYKDIVGWRRVRACMHDKTRVKFFRLIWDDPEEYI